MKIYLATKVAQKPADVFAKFDEDLFNKLTPPGIKVSLDRFDGCKKNDEVHLILDFIFFKQKWNSLIIDSGNDTDGFYFVDEGIKLPFFLKTWKHVHRINFCQDGSKIIDDICFKTGLLVTDYLLYPILYFQFLYRKPVYKRIFDV